MNKEAVIQNLKTSAIDAGLIPLGMIAANVGVKTIKQDNVIANGILALGGFAGSAFVKHPALKALLLGVSVFGTLRCATIGLNTITEPGATEGIAGLIPEGMKEKIRKFIPQLSGDEELDSLTGDEINLDDVGTIDIPYEEVSGDGTAGIGEVERLLI